MFTLNNTALISHVVRAAQFLGDSQLYILLSGSSPLILTVLLISRYCCCRCNDLCYNKIYIYIHIYKSFNTSGLKENMSCVGILLLINGTIIIDIHS